MNYRFDIELDDGDILVGVKVASAIRGYPATREDPGMDDEIEYDIEYVVIGDENGDSVVLSGDDAPSWLNENSRFEELDMAVYKYLTREDE